MHIVNRLQKSKNCYEVRLFNKNRSDIVPSSLQIQKQNRQSNSVCCLAAL